MKDDISISYEPFKQVVIMEYMRFNTPDDLARFLNVAAGGKPTGLYWANEVAFFLLSFGKQHRDGYQSFVG